MTIIYKFTEEEQRALVTVAQILSRIYPAEYKSSKDNNRFWDAFCTIDSLCEGIPENIWTEVEEMMNG